MVDDLPLHETDSSMALSDITIVETDKRNRNSVLQIMSTTKADVVPEDTHSTIATPARTLTVNNTTHSSRRRCLVMSSMSSVVKVQGPESVGDLMH